MISRPFLLSFGISLVCSLAVSVAGLTTIAANAADNIVEIDGHNATDARLALTSTSPATQKIGNKDYWLSAVELPVATGDQQILATTAYNHFTHNYQAIKSFPYRDGYKYWHLTNGSKMVLCVWADVANPDDALGWAAIDRQPGTWRVSFGGKTATLHAPGNWYNYQPGQHALTAVLPGSHNLKDDTYVDFIVGAGGKLRIRNPENETDTDKEYIFMTFTKR